ncbi:MAG TPA: cell division protein FtsL [Actinomycetota bacterium]|nr:cell division protein FtsL [Actinomycetota bacterium]
MSAARPQKTQSKTQSKPSSKPELKLVQRRKSKRLIKRTGARRMAPFTILAGIAIGAVIAGVLLEQVVLAQSAFKLAHIREEVAEAEENREVLMLEAAKLDSAARIERYARENLGMIEPEPTNVRYIVADIRSRALGNLAAATRARYGAAARGAAAAALGAADADAP